MKKTFNNNELSFNNFLNYLTNYCLCSAKFIPDYLFSNVFLFITGNIKHFGLPYMLKYCLLSGFSDTDVFI